MAYIRKLTSGWRAEVQKHGNRSSRHARNQRKGRQHQQAFHTLLV
jgi:hypothetical protein